MNPTQTEQLVRLLIRHQEDLFRYIYSLLPHEEDARDVLQETSVALYRKFSSYDPAKPFLAWAFGFAYLQVLKQREENVRCRLHLRKDIVELLARDRETQATDLQCRLEALDDCLNKLAPRDRQLIQERYTSNCSINELVERLGSSRRTLFRDLDRIRSAIQECIGRHAASARR